MGKMFNLRRITDDEFHKLKLNNTVYAKCGEHIYLSRVLQEPILNFDADDPDWEIETNNGWFDIYSLYVIDNNLKNEKEKENMKIYTVSGRTTKQVIDSTINILIGHYQCNQEVMDDKERIDNLENIVDLIKIKDNI